MTCPKYMAATERAAEACGLVTIDSVCEIIGLTYAGFHRIQQTGVVPEAIGRLGAKKVWDRRFWERVAQIAEVVGGGQSSMRFGISAVQAIDAGHLAHEGAEGEAEAQSEREARALALIDRISKTPREDRVAVLLAEADGLKVAEAATAEVEAAEEIKEEELA